MAFPCAGKRFIMESGNLAQPKGTGNCRDIFPLLVSLKNFLRHRGTLLVNTTVLENLPHAILCIYHIWHVKRSQC